MILYCVSSKACALPILFNSLPANYYESEFGLVDKERQRICIYMRAGQLGDIQAGIDSDDGEYDDDSEDQWQ